MDSMKTEVLDYGSIELVDYMGGDRRILEAARVSTGSEVNKGDIKDRGLIRYLVKNEHWSPFQKCIFEFKVKMPIFVARQWMRHNLFYNEMSGRYTEMPEQCHMPTQFRLQGITNHQGSGENIDPQLNQNIIEMLTKHYEEVWKLYHAMIDFGVAREQARMHLPLSTYTELFWTVDLRTLYNFLKLRRHDHSQKEIRVYADALNEMLLQMPNFKWAVEIINQLIEVQWKMQKVIGADKTPDLREVNAMLDTQLLGGL